MKMQNANNSSQVFLSFSYSRTVNANSVEFDICNIWVSLLIEHLQHLGFSFDWTFAAFEHLQHSGFSLLRPRHSVLKGGGPEKCVNKVNQWSQVVPMVEVNGDPRGADFFLSFGLFLWPKTASKCYKWGIFGQKPPWCLQIGCTAWIKVGSQQETSGPMCRNHFWDLKLP